MNREELAQQLKEVAEMLEKGNGEASIESFVERVLSATSESDMLNVVGEFMHQMKAKGGEGALEKWLRDNGWVKIGEEVPIGAVVNAIGTMPPDCMRKVCRDLLQQLIDHSADVRSALAYALDAYDYVEKGSDEFEDLAKEWAEDNDWIYLDDWSFEDVANRYDEVSGSNVVRDFVVEYIESHL